MFIKCKSCDTELSEDEYGGAISPATLCPHCGETLQRNITIHLSGAVFGISGAMANLTVFTYPEALVDEVRDLIERKKFSIAVVVAQMACEISVERALSSAFKNKDLDYLEGTVSKMLPSCNITNERVKKLYDALTGGNIYEDLQYIWQGLINLASLRNAAVHSGTICTEAQARASLEIATQLVKHFKP